MSGGRSRRLSDDCVSLVRELIDRLGDGEHQKEPDWHIWVINSPTEGQTVKAESSDTILIVHCYKGATTLVATTKDSPTRSLELIFREGEEHPRLDHDIDWVREKIAELRTKAPH